MSKKEEFWMFPFNETGEETKKKGVRIPGEMFGLEYDLFYIEIEKISLLVDEITGMVVWGEASEDSIEEPIEYFKSSLDKKAISRIKEVHANCLKNGIILKHCSKKIKVRYPKQNLFSDARSIPAVFSKFEFKKYFKNIIYQKDFGAQTTTTDSVVISPTNFIIPKARNEKNIDLVSINIAKHTMVPSVHVLKLPNITRRGMCDTVSSFSIGKYYFAHYIKDTNVLVLSDISKNKEIEWFNPIFDYLRTNFFKEIKNISDKAYEITVGCDPEFELYNSENRLLVGEDINAEGRLQRKIGADGHGKQLELRPNPSVDPGEVVEDIANMFRAVSHLRVNAKGDKEPLGGHIHFGCFSNYADYYLRYSDVVVDMLDSFIGKHTRVMNGKARGGYGNLGDIRDQPWGFEYRVAPAAVFATKEMARITMKLGKNLIEKILKEDILCNLPLGIEDLKQFLTEQEAEYYLNFPDLYKTLDTEDIVKYWIDEKCNYLTIKFFDKWDPAIKSIYIKGLSDTIVDAPTTICLYGIKGNKASGIETLGPSLPHPRGVHCEEGIAIGLPKDCRTTGLFAKEIIKDIKRKIGSINGAYVPRVTAILFQEEMIGCDVTPDTREDEIVRMERNDNRIFREEIDEEDEEGEY